MNPLMRFKQLLSMATNPDSQIINEVTDIARVLHSTQSFEAATALIEFIVNVSIFELTLMILWYLEPEGN